MIKSRIVLFATLSLISSLFAAQDPIDWDADAEKKLGFTAERIAVDNITKSAVATGNVVVVAEPLTIRGDEVRREADGTFYAKDGMVTTCTNEVGHLHWSAGGNLEFREHESIVLRGILVKFYEIPILWWPYIYYPLETDYGIRVMPGYTSRWGAYLLTKYVYPIAGDGTYEDNKWWLDGNSRLELRTKNGVALGQAFLWNLGDYGHGRFKVHYAWDENYDRIYRNRDDRYNADHWYSEIERDRYAVEFKHNWDISERDYLRMGASVFSDSLFRQDFFRNNRLNIKNEWLGYHGGHLAWEHNELLYSYGAEVSGPLNDFYSMTGRLPEIYFDIVPQPLFSTPVNFESANRIGYLTRDYAKYGRSAMVNPFNRSPGVWAEYEAFRFDTYNRLSIPFKTCADVLAVVPRVGYHGTYWNHLGDMRDGHWYDGREKANNVDGAWRSIAEAGVTFSARGTAWVSDYWQHMIEPYADVLAQDASYSNRSKSSRPYIFDNIDASVIWEDQFAGRGRNLPYSYVGITPGVRNAWSKLTESGRLRQVLDVDVYVALQFNKSKRLGREYGRFHEMAELGDPNYGKDDVMIVPGFRTRWTPSDDMSLAARAEYDSENEKLALADVAFSQTVSSDLKYSIGYSLRDYRAWDFSSTPFDAALMKRDLNEVYFHSITAEITHQPIYFFAWGPFVRWDARENELDRIGSHFDYLTDCLCFRFSVSYINDYRFIDGSEYDDDWNFSFMVFLRHFNNGENGVFGF